MTSPTTEQIDLGSQLDIAHARELQDRLAALFESKSPHFEFNAGSVTKVDAAGLQVLAAFVDKLAREDVEFGWLSSSEPIQEAAYYAGLQDKLGLSSAPSKEN